MPLRHHHETMIMSHRIIAYLCLGVFLLVLASFNACAIKNTNTQFPNTDSDLSVEELRRENEKNLNSLQVGMAKSKVKEIMRFHFAEQQFLNGSYKVTNPFKIATYEGTIKPIEVYYYFTKTTDPYPGTRFLVNPLSPRIRDYNLVPLVFHDQILLGWGAEFLSHYEKENNLSTPHVNHGVQ